MSPAQLPLFKRILYIDVITLRLEQRIDKTIVKKIEALGCEVRNEYLGMKYRPSYCYSLRISRVTITNLKWIGVILKSHHYIINNIEVAQDILPNDPDDLSALREFMDENLFDVKSRKIAYSVGNQDGTIYSNRRKSRKNFVYYSDKLCRMVSTECPCLHMEFRFKGKQSIETYLKISTLEELSEFNFNQFWRDSMTFGTIKNSGSEWICKILGLPDLMKLKRAIVMKLRSEQEENIIPPDTMLNYMYFVRDILRNNKKNYPIDFFIKRQPNPFVPAKRVRLWVFMDDREWKEVKACCPSVRGQKKSREVMNKIIGVACYGWKELKEVDPQWQSVYNKFSYWKRRGVFLEMVRHQLFHKLLCLKNVSLPFFCDR